MKVTIIHEQTSAEYELFKVGDTKYIITCKDEHLYYTADEIMTYLMQGVWIIKH